MLSDLISCSAVLHFAGLLLWITVLGLVFAKVEIQIEGPNGWAAGLPTWRIESHPLLRVFWGGRPLTGYHFWVFLFMALAFHLPVFLAGQFSLALEARILGSLMIFWIIEDFLWFVLNPAFGIRRLNRQSVPWHKQWLGPVPLDYVTFLVAGVVLLVCSFRMFGGGPPG